MVVLDFYRGVLSAAGMEVDEDNRIYIQGAKTKKYVKVSNKTLVLPEREVLKDPDWEKYIAFHPTCESSVRAKDSPVLRKLRTILMGRINLLTLTVMENLVALAADKNRNSELGPDFNDFMKLVAKAGPKTVANFEKIEKRFDPSKYSGRLVNLYSKRRSEVNGTEYARVCHVTFPFMDTAEDNNDVTIMDVKISSKENKKLLQRIFEFIFPESNSVNMYSSYTNSTSAAGLRTLLEASARLFERLNDIIEMFELQEVAPVTNLDWVEGLDNFSKYRVALGVLEGNQGENVDEPEDEPVEETKTGKSMADLADDQGPAPAKPTQQRESAPAKSSGDVDPNGWMKVLQPKQEPARGSYYRDEPAPPRYYNDDRHDPRQRDDRYVPDPYATRRGRQEPQYGARRPGDTGYSGGGWYGDRRREPAGARRPGRVTGGYRY